ncbi:thioredoxin [Halioxenophilus aromaticivorans]|uniref:Thioredoxin n=1 Tax=Halioxenophilus aromaticivorans TaxID=1306992 RepID=A0AAV3TY34_9ALTE
MEPVVVDITQENAQQLLIEESKIRPVVVDFWAEWCSHCKTLTPLLERLAQEYNGQFLLAKIDADEQQMIASQLGVRSLPTVMIFKDGQPVDGFAGAQPESEIRQLLEKYLPEPWREDVNQAQMLMSEGQFTPALEPLRSALAAAPESSEVLLLLTQCYLELNRLDEAEKCLESIKMVDQDDVYKTLLARLELQRESAKSPEVEALEQQLATNPEDANLKLQLAVQYNQSGMHGDALELLIGILRKDLNFQDGEAKRLFLDMLATLGKSDPIAIKYQRKYYTLLY